MYLLIIFWLYIYFDSNFLLPILQKHLCELVLSHAPVKSQPGNISLPCLFSHNMLYFKNVKYVVQENSQIQNPDNFAFLQQFDFA